MRFWLARVFVMAGLLFGATGARAFSLTMTSDFPPGAYPVPGMIVNVQLHLDATDPGIQLLAVNVLFDPIVLRYNPLPNASVGVPSYILYGMTPMGMGSSALYAQQDPWQIWPGMNVPGRNQVNVNWADASFAGTYVTGTGIKIAQLQFQVIASNGLGVIEMSLSAAGGIFQVDGNPNSPIALNGTPIYLIPEPATALLVGIGMVVLASVDWRHPRQAIGDRRAARTAAH